MPTAAHQPSAVITSVGKKPGLLISIAIRCVWSARGQADWCRLLWLTTSCRIRVTQLCFGILATGSRCVNVAMTARRPRRMEVLEMEGIEVFRKLRDVCDDVIKAFESNDEAAIENSLGRFMLLMVQLDAIK